MWFASSIYFLSAFRFQCKTIFIPAYVIISWLPSNFLFKEFYIIATCGFHRVNRIPAFISCTNLYFLLFIFCVSLITYSFSIPHRTLSLHHLPTKIYWTNTILSFDGIPAIYIYIWTYLSQIQKKVVYY